MKLHFDPNQTYQKDAINSVVKIFEGQPLNKGDFEISGNGGALTFSELGFGNNVSLTESEILNNLQQVQSENEINPSEKLERFSYHTNGTGREDNANDLQLSVDSSTHLPLLQCSVQL